MLPKDLYDLLNRFSECIDLFFRVVESKGRARGCRNLEALHDRLGTMVAGANGDALLIQVPGD